ncbi:MAG: hypothetical protein IJZ59_07160 [Alphaproteobacteria bacterium]|nr:hypothetical protein [Alphaproteobacteria bacterium]
MKKYFLLATTALLLGTSNVIAAGHDPDAAAGGSVSATINISADMAYTPTIEILNDINWGKIYHSCNGGNDLIASFDADGFSASEIVNGYTGQQQGRIKLSSLPAGGSVSIDAQAYMGNGFGMEEMSLSQNTDGEYVVLGKIYCHELQGLNGNYTGTATITVTY